MTFNKSNLINSCRKFAACILYENSLRTWATRPCLEILTLQISHKKISHCLKSSFRLVFSAEYLLQTSKVAYKIKTKNKRCGGCRQYRNVRQNNDNTQCTLQDVRLTLNRRTNSYQYRDTTKLHFIRISTSLNYIHFKQNFGKCGTILITLSLLHVETNCEGNKNYNYHVVSK